jgi:DNA topoisomerase-2
MSSPASSAGGLPQTGDGDGKPAMDRSVKYRKLTQLEHVAHRGSMYLGSMALERTPQWVATLNDVGPEDAASLTVARKDVAFVPAVFKLYDEVVTNAVDASAGDATLTFIKITVGKTYFSVQNNGVGIPVSRHAVYADVYVPELVFGHLNVSSNYDDEVERAVAGQNGLGVKLVNIFSDKFVVKVKDSETGTVFYKEWFDGMQRTSDAKIKLKAAKPATGDVDVYAQPRAELMLPEGEFTDDHVALFLKRALDLCCVTGDKVKVYFNGTKLPVVNFKQYVRAVMGDATTFVAVDDANPHWRVAVAFSEAPAVHGLVNCAAAGGAHVAYVERLLYAELTKALDAKREFKALQIKAASLRTHVTLFVVATVSQPTFSSQVKDTCVSYASRLSDYVPSEAFIKRILASPVVTTAAEQEKAKTERKLAKATDGKKTCRVVVPKLVDAINAGTAKSGECSLILTEGDSAKAFAVAGLAVIGHDKYGVFPLKGKLLNTREATTKQVMENTEIKHIKTILGLQHNNAHEGGAGLRYGSVIILTDSDADGSHIKGLFLNFLHTNWPALAKSGFVKTMPTPLVKATRGALSHAFHTMPELQTWLDANADGAGFKMKYYKGLGTWSSAEAKEIFKTTPAVKFVDDADADASLLLGFEAKKADERKAWILANTAVPPSLSYTGHVRISDFVNGELVYYSIYNVSRSIPSLIDGLKTSQRKVLFTVFARNYTTAAREVKVAQLAGAVAERTLYLHGEQSLNDAIINMAKSYAGSNNVPLLHGAGQFGTRLCNGDDSASPRYIFTYAGRLTRRIFNELDDALLTMKREEGVEVEPAHYCPIVPVVLLNGVAGISTGFSTFVPSFNPKDVVANVNNFIEDKPFEPMVPWFQSFLGTVEMVGSDKYLVKGCVEQKSPRVFVVSELPIGGKSFTDYAEWLADADKSPVKLLENRSTDTKLPFQG